jgi:predicted transcriptional regulator
MKIRELVRSDHCLTRRMIAYELDVSKETLRKVSVQDIGMRKLTAKFMLRNLMEERKDKHLTLCMDFAEEVHVYNFLDRVIIS